MQYEKITAKNGFTLVELLVVITILAILGTIGFVSIRGYATQARDATRISDLKIIEKTFTFHKTKGNNYPQPDNAVDYTYSGSVVWSQGEFGEGAMREIQDLNSIPTDPLSKNRYSYSLHSNNREFQISGVVESDITTKNETHIFPKTYAGGQRKGKTHMVGNYNRVISKSTHPSIPSHIFILALPSITSGDMNVTDIGNLLDQEKLSYGGLGIIPGSYANNLNSDFEDSPAFLYNSSNIEIFNGPATALDSWETRIDILESIQTAYISTPVLDYDPELRGLVQEPLDTTNPSEISLLNACSLLKNGGLYDGNCFVKEEQDVVVTDLVISDPNPCGFTTSEVSSLNTFFAQDPTFTSKTHIQWCDSRVITYSNISGDAPDALGKIDVTHFHMNDNALTSLPSTLSSWTNITELHIENNNVSSLPNGLADITSLTSVNFNNNPGLGNLSRFIDIYSGAYTQLGVTDAGLGMTISGVGFHPTILIVTF